MPGGIGDMLRVRAGATLSAPTGFAPRFAKRVEKGSGRFGEVPEPTTVSSAAATTATQGKGAIEEQGLRAQTRGGWVPPTVCSPPHVDAMAEHVTRQMDGKLRLVMGGFHTGGASRRGVEGVIETFQRLGVRVVAPCHCCGDASRELFERHNGDRYMVACVGTSVRFRGEQPVHRMPRGHEKKEPGHAEPPLPSTFAPPEAHGCAGGRRRYSAPTLRLNAGLRHLDVHRAIASKCLGPGG